MCSRGLRFESLLDANYPESFCVVSVSKRIRNSSSYYAMIAFFHISNSVIFSYNPTFWLYTYKRRQWHGINGMKVSKCIKNLFDTQLTFSSSLILYPCTLILIQPFKVQGICVPSALDLKYLFVFITDCIYFLVCFSQCEVVIYSYRIQFSIFVK